MTSKPTTRSADPGQITPGQRCGCGAGCPLHSGKPCPAKHYRRHPGTHTTVHLTATPNGPRCPYCLYITTNRAALLDRAEAAHRRPSADGVQGDLFDTAPHSEARR